MISGEEFKKEVFGLAKKVKVQPKEVHIRNMNRKWASCSSRGRLTFHPDLLKEPKRKRAEVVLHELLHLKYQNHGKMFKSLLDIYLRRV